MAFGYLYLLLLAVSFLESFLYFSFPLVLNVSLIANYFQFEPFLENHSQHELGFKKAAMKKPNPWRCLPQEQEEVPSAGTDGSEDFGPSATA